MNIDATDGQQTSELEIQRQILIKSAQLQSDLTVWSLLQSIAEGIVAIDEDGRILVINSRLESMLGYSLSDLLGKPVDILVPEKFRAAHQGMVRKFFTSPRIRPMGTGIDLFANKKDGSVISVEISLSFLKTNIGQIGLALLTDITSRKKAEAIIKEQNDGLEMFSRAVAHNLQSSVNGIVGISEVLADDPDKLSREEKQEFLLLMLESGRKMSDVIKDLLLLAKVGKEQVQLIACDPCPLIESVLSRLKVMIDSKGATIHISDTLDRCVGYPGWIEEVFYNLVSNAIAYGGVPPVVSITSERLSDGIHVAYHIHDNGPGLSEENAAALLDETSPIRPNLIRGHGLGLSISARIAEKIGARLQVKSILGSGSTFSIVAKSE